MQLKKAPYSTLCATTYSNITFLLFLLLFLLLFFMLFIPSLHAKPTEVITITAQRNATPLSKLTGNTSLIQSEDIQLNAAQHPSQILQSAAGTWLSRGNGQESLLSIRSPVLTGAGSCGEFLMMEDGISLSARGFCNVNQLFMLNYTAANTIEVLKGANSARYGANAIHGLINMTTARPKTSSQYAKLDIGAHQYLQLQTQQRLQVNEQDIWQFNINAKHDGGHKDSSGYQQYQINSQYFTQNHNGNIDITHAVAINTLDQQTAGYLQAGQNAYLNKSLSKQNNFPDAYRKANAVRYHAALTGQLELPNWADSNTNLNTNSNTSKASNINSKKVNNRSATWKIVPYLRSQDMTFLMHFLPGTPTEKSGHDSIGIQASLQSEDPIYNSNSNHFDAYHQLSWLIGSEAEYTQGYLKQAQANPTNSDSAFLNGILPQGEHYNYTVNSQMAALFGQVSYLITPKLTLNAATRFDIITFDYNNKIINGNTQDNGTPCQPNDCRYTRPADRQDSFSHFSHNVELGYALSPNLYSYIKLDHAFRAPHNTELYRLQNGQTQADIGDQVINSAELGFHLNQTNYQLDAAIFFAKKDNVIFFDANRNYLDDAKTQHQGIELEWQYKISKTVDLSIATTWADHTYQNSIALSGIGDINITGKQIDTAPKQISHARINWQPTEQLNLQIEANKLSDYFLEPTNQHHYSGHTLINLRGQYQFNKSWQASFQLLNIQNKAYAERADYAFGQYRYFVGEPRSLYVGIRYSWAL